jgi:hypothetical protein
MQQFQRHCHAILTVMHAGGHAFKGAQGQGDGHGQAGWQDAAHHNTGFSHRHGRFAHVGVEAELHWQMERIEAHCLPSP